MSRPVQDRVPEPEPPRAVIPYVEWHTGPRRVLTLDLTSNATVTAKHRPVVGVDGRHYVVVWGRVAFEIPADRNVHLSVHLEAEHLTQAASILLVPSSEPVLLAYATQWSSGVGKLEHRG